MNDQTLLLPHQRTDIYQAMLELLQRVRAARIRHEVLRDQAERAAISSFLAIGQGLPHDGPRMRAQYFARAKASLGELVTATDAARAIGAMSATDWHASQELAVRVRAMLIALLR
jgi:four helix bundle protein